MNGNLVVRDDQVMVSDLRFKDPHPKKCPRDLIMACLPLGRLKIGGRCNNRTGYGSYTTRAAACGIGKLQRQVHGR